MTVVALFLVSKNAHMSKGSFIRLIPPHLVSNFRYLDIKYNSFYISGIVSDSIYLGNLTAPTTICIAGISLLNAHYTHIPVPAGLSLAIRNIRFSLNYPYSFLIDGQTGSVLHNVFPDLNYTGVYHIPLYAIEDVKAISANSYLIKSYDTGRHQSDLSKISEGSKEVLSPTALLERQIDGHFCTDGLLLLSPVSPRLVYIYYYRNQYITLDTNLTVLYRGRTIDTNTIAKIALDTVAVNKTQQSVIFKSPPLLINKAGCLYGNKLFIQSPLAASNEDPAVFREVSTIDVYDLDKRKYKFSFYIPDFKGYKARQFQVYGKGIAVLYDKYLAVYSLSQDILN